MTSKVSKLIPKDEIASTYQIWFKRFSDEEVLGHDLGFFDQKMREHSAYLVEQETDEVLKEEVEDRWKFFIGNLPKELARRQKKLKSEIKHTRNLKQNLGDGAYNDALLAREYLQAYRHSNESTKKLIDKIWVMIKEAGGIPVSRETISTVYAVMLAEDEEKALERLKKKIAYNGKLSPREAIAALGRFLAPALASSDPKKINLVAEGLYHFMWQVKRKMNDMPVERHLMLLFISWTKGNGKSSFCRNFTNLFFEAHADFYSERFTDDLVDESKIRNMVHNYIINFDEMKGPTKGGFENFRSFVTAERLKIRPLFQTHEETIRTKYTTFGNANAEKVGDIYGDMQGERRILSGEVSVQGFENVTPTDLSLLTEFGHLTPEQVEKKHLYPFEGFKAEVFWQMVDENAACQLTMDYLREHQAADKPENGIESFALHYGLQPHIDPTQSIYLYPAKRMHQLYREQQLRLGNKYRILNYKDFSEQLCLWLIAHHDDNKSKALKIEDIKRESKFSVYRDTTCYFLQRSVSLDSAYNIVEHANTLPPPGKDSGKDAESSPIESSPSLNDAAS